MRRLASRLTVGLVLFVCAVSWMGCSGPKWCHPDPNRNTQAEFARDKYQCHGEALERARNFGAPGNIFIIIDYQKQCMQVRGWTTACSAGGTESAPQGVVSSLRAEFKKAFQEKRYDDCIRICNELLQLPGLTTKQRAIAYFAGGTSTPSEKNICRPWQT